MKKTKVVANIYSKWSHISVILTGLAMLRKNNEIDLNINDYADKGKENFKKNAGLELIIDNKKVYVDVSDGYNNVEFMKENIPKYDYYFKRSYSEEMNKKYNFKGIKPLGLNYEVYSKDIDINYLQTTKLKIKKKILNILGLKNADQIYLEDLTTKNININKNLKICFTARLWDLPGKDIEKINEKRIQLVRELRKKYGKNFFGGIYMSRLSCKMCPDLIVSRFYTYKLNYINRMKKCDICIATTGLHNSIGWKFAEYVIASKAIISEKLNYFVPGEFKEGVNYLTFDSVEECLEKIDFLENNVNEIEKMSINNRKYFNSYLSPESQVKGIIDFVISNKI